MVPAVLSASVYQVMVFLNTVLASLLEEGSVGLLYFADRLFQFPLGVFTIALATALLPTLSRYASQNENEAFDQTLTDTLCWATFVTLPATAGLIILADPLISAILEYKHFTAASSARTALALCGFAYRLFFRNAGAYCLRHYARLHSF